MTASGIYLDYNATTPCDPRVVERMLPFFTEIYGNPANGLHRQGRLAAQAVDEAREQVANFIGVNSEEIYFTSGATESNNLAIAGVANVPNIGKRRRIITSCVEHKSVMLPCKKLAQSGYEVVFLPVNSKGRVSTEDAEAAIDAQTLLVTIQAANNEIGTLQPIAEISEIAHHHGAIMHTDAAQLVGKMPVDLSNLDIDMLSMSAHKLYGPKGIGALYVHGGIRNIHIEPVFLGGGQEGGLRSGTTNVPAIVGFGEACRIAGEVQHQESIQIATLRDQLEHALRANISILKINGSQVQRLPNTSSLTFPGIDADALLLNLPNVMMGTGSACTSGAIEPSHVLQAIGLSRDEVSSTIRTSLGRFTTENDIYKAGILIIEAYNRISHPEL
jgi:cysteine desulfurase